MINETDISLAKASNAIVIGFNVKPNKEAKNAEEQKVRIEFFNVIYKAIEFVEKSLSGLLEPEEKNNTGHPEILKIFKLSKSGKVAGLLRMVKLQIILRQELFGMAKLFMMGK